MGHRKFTDFTDIFKFHLKNMRSKKPDFITKNRVNTRITANYKDDGRRLKIIKNEFS